MNTFATLESLILEIFETNSNHDEILNKFAREQARYQIQKISAFTNEMVEVFDFINTGDESLKETVREVSEEIFSFDHNDSILEALGDNLFIIASDYSSAHKAIVVINNNNKLAQFTGSVYDVKSSIYSLKELVKTI